MEKNWAMEWKELALQRLKKLPWKKALSLSLSFSLFCCVYETHSVLLVLTRIIQIIFSLFPV